MKKFLQFAGLIGAVLGLIAFILLMTTHAIEGTGVLDSWYGGTTVIFGKGPAKVGIGGTFEGNPAWVALIAWIFILVGFLCLLVLFVLPLLKVKALDKFAKLFTFIAGGLLVAAGILSFFAIPAFCGANDFGTNNLSLGAGWVIAAILSIVGGGIAMLPPILGMVKK